MNTSKISDYIFLKEDIYFIKNNGKIFAKSFSLDDLLAIEDILIKYNWNLDIFRNNNFIFYQSNVFRVLTLNEKLLFVSSKFNKSSISEYNSKSKYIFMNGEYYFLIKNSKILGVFNSLNHAFIAETLLKNNMWDLNKLCHKLYYISEHWIVIDIVDDVLIFLFSSLFPDKIKTFFDNTKIKKDFSFIDFPKGNVNQLNSINRNIKKNYRKRSKAKSKTSNKKNISKKKSKVKPKSSINKSSSKDNEESAKQKIFIENTENEDYGFELTFNSKESKEDNLKNDFFKLTSMRSNNLKRVDKYIFEKDNKFVIIQSNKLYGVSYKKQGAFVIKNLLDSIEWNFHKFNTLENIIYKDDYYWVIDVSNNYILCVDFFKDYDDALDCYASKKFKNNNVDGIKIYSDVLIKKIDNQFHLTVKFYGKNILFGIFPFKRHADVAKIILEKNDFNLERIIENNGIFFEYGKYWLVSVNDGLLDVVGSFDTYDEAFEYYKGIEYDLNSAYVFLTKNTDFIEEDEISSEIGTYEKPLNKYDIEPIKKQENSVKKDSSKPNVKFNSSNRKINDYIYQMGEKYHIFHMVDGEFEHFGEFNSLGEANDYLEFLIAVDWNVNR